MDFKLLSLLLLLIDFVPLTNYLCKFVVIVAIPAVSLGLEVYLCSIISKRWQWNYLILSEVPLSILDTDLSGSLCASLMIVSDGATVSAGAFSVLCHLVLVCAEPPSIPCIIERLLSLLGAPHSLMGECFFLGSLLIRQIPWCLLNILRHMSQVHFWLIVRWNCVSSCIFHYYYVNI